MLDDHPTSVPGLIASASKKTFVIENLTRSVTGTGTMFYPDEQQVKQMMRVREIP